MFTAININIHIVSLLGPGHYVPLTRVVFDQGCEAFHPVAIVHIPDAIYVFYLCVMYVSADHTIIAFFPAVAGQVYFKLEHKIHGLFHTVF